LDINGNWLWQWRISVCVWGKWRIGELQTGDRDKSDSVLR
jgi:hypothetical protein